MYQLGFTKIYFRADQVSVLEKLREQVMLGMYKVENLCLGGRVVHDFRELMSGIVTLQSCKKVAIFSFKDEIAYLFV